MVKLDIIKLEKQIIEFCSRAQSSSKITAIAITGGGYSPKNDTKSFLEILVVNDKLSPKIMSYIKSFNETTALIVTVDKWFFERDIETGFLGEAIAGKLVFPYTTLYGSSYLHEKEITLKKRLILEMLEDLSYNYPELTYKILIKPQYFLYETISLRIKFFPLLIGVFNFISEGKLNESEALKGYNEALNLLETENIISFTNGLVSISKKFVTQSQDPKKRLINLSKNASRTLFSTIFGIIPQIMNLLQNAQHIALLKIPLNRRNQYPTRKIFIEPQKYVLFPTTGGLISLADKVDIKGFAKKMLLNGADFNSIKVEPYGGMLNDLFLIHFSNQGENKKILVKRFKDWSGFKWFPLYLWSFGTRSFSVLGHARLAKECAANEFLRCDGFNVPKILAISNVERLIFMEFIEGKDLSQTLKQIAMTGNQEEINIELSKIEQAGEIFAKVHAHNMTLGDTKPENVLINPEGKIYLIDFEQSTEDGDKAWDIAEFLYYSGHYLQQLYAPDNKVKAQLIADAFIRGYLSGGGNVNNIKKAADNKYTRIFSVFTLPVVLKTISNACKNAKATHL